jgi:hypothetical protein
MPAYLPMFFLALVAYGVCFLSWAGLKQRKRGKTKSAKYLFSMAAFMFFCAAALFTAKILKSGSP